MFVNNIRGQNDLRAPHLKFLSCIFFFFFWRGFNLIEQEPVKELFCHMVTGGTRHADMRTTHYRSPISRTSWSGKFWQYRDRQLVRMQFNGQGLTLECETTSLFFFLKTEKLTNLGLPFRKYYGRARDSAMDRDTRDTLGARWVFYGCWLLTLAGFSTVSELIHQHPALWQLTSQHRSLALANLAGRQLRNG